MTKRRPGQWPVTQPADLGEGFAQTETPTADELYVQRAAETALRELVMDSIKHALRQQPTASCVRVAARRLCNEITAAAEDIARTKRSSA